MPPPQPWDIVVQPMGLFRDEVKLIEIPNTAQVEVSNIILIESRSKLNGVKI